MTLVDDVKDQVQDISSASSSEFLLTEQKKAMENEVVSDADEEGTTSNDSKVSDELVMPISCKRKAMDDKSNGLRTSMPSSSSRVCRPSCQNKKGRLLNTPQGKCMVLPLQRGLRSLKR